MTAKRVLMTADTLGGVWNYSLDLARALPDVQFTIATMGRRLSPAQRQQVSALRNVAIRESELKLEWMDEPWSDVDAAGEWLLEIAREVQPDVIHLNGYAHAVLDWQAPVIVVAHSCVLSWWRAVKGGEAPPQYGEYRQRVAAGLDAADQVVAPTAAMLGLLRENYEVQVTGRVVPNGRNHSDFAPSRKLPQIFSAGRLWDEAKNIILLNAIAPRLSWPIAIAGDDRHPNGTRAALLNVGSLGMLTNEELSRHLAESAIYVSPARYEPFGLAVLEAALCSCALVLSDIPTFRELWDDAAVFVPVDDRDGFVRTLEALIGNAPRREEMGLRARERALHFTLDRMANGYREVYADVLSEQEVPA
jgi:glycosyltransferase involved in cell wall biosynthesis